MRRECRERFPRHRLQRKPLVSDPGIHHGTCVTHVPWCMSESLNSGCGENFPGLPGACATRKFTYPARGPWGCLRLVYYYDILTTPYWNAGDIICIHLNLAHRSVFWWVFEEQVNITSHRPTRTFPTFSYIKEIAKYACFSIYSATHQCRIIGVD